MKKKSKVQLPDRSFNIPDLDKLQNETRDHYPYATGYEAPWLNFFWIIFIAPQKCITVHQWCGACYWFFADATLEKRLHVPFPDRFELAWRARIYWKENFPSYELDPQFDPPPDLATLGKIIPCENCPGYTKEFEQMVRGILWMEDNPSRPFNSCFDHIGCYDLSTVYLPWDDTQLIWGEDRNPRWWRAMKSDYEPKLPSDGRRETDETGRPTYFRSLSAPPSPDDDMEEEDNNSFVTSCALKILDDETKDPKEDLEEGEIRSD